MSDPLIGTLLRDHEVLQRLDRVSLARMYRVRHRPTGVERTLKLVAPELLAGEADRTRFLRDAEALKALRHPSVALLIDYGILQGIAGIDDGSAFLLAEALSGTSLRGHLDSRGALPRERVLTLFTGLLAGLGEAHARGITHRGITPDHVYLVSEEGGDRALLVDFALEVPSTREALALLAGTPWFTASVAYLSPEEGGALAAGASLDSRTDLYSLAAVLYEALTGRTPFSGPPEQILKRKFQVLPALPSGVAPQQRIPEELDRLVLALLEKDREQRPDTAEEARTALERMRTVEEDKTELFHRTAEYNTAETGVLDKGSQVEEYTIDKVIGQGGMGAVYRAHHRLLGVARAIKVVKPELVKESLSRERFLREAQILARLEHPNLVRVYDCRPLPSGALYMVQELVEGESLRARIKREVKLDAAAVIPLFVGAARGLGAAHRLGVVHRNVSPDNLMVIHDERGRETVKVIDFGIAKARDTNQAELTVTHAFVGKLEYASPEQAGRLEAGEELDGRSDIYSLGITLFRVLAGKLPFEAPNPQGYLAKHLMTPPPSLQSIGIEVPPRLDQLILRMLAKDRRERPQTMEEVAELLEASIDPGPAAAGGEPRAAVKPEARATASAPAPTRPTPPRPVAATAPPPPRSSRILWIGGIWLVAVSALVIFAIWYTVNQSDQVRQALTTPPRRPSVTPVPAPSATIPALPSPPPAASVEPEHTPVPTPTPLESATPAPSHETARTPPPVVLPTAAPGTPVPDAARVAAEEGMRQLRRGQIDRAFVSLEKARMLDPRNVAALEGMRQIQERYRSEGDAAYGRGDYAAARKLYQQAQAALDDPEMRARLAQAFTPPPTPTPIAVAVHTPTPPPATPVATPTPTPAPSVIHTPVPRPSEAGSGAEEADWQATVGSTDRTRVIEYLRKYPRGRHLGEALERLDARSQGEVALTLVRLLRQRGLKGIEEIGNARDSIDFFSRLGIAPCIGVWDEAARLLPDDFKCIAGLNPHDPGEPYKLDMGRFVERVRQQMKERGR